MSEDVLEVDWNAVANLERAIMHKFGEKVVQNPLKFWNSNKEQEYQQQKLELERGGKKRRNQEKWTVTNEGVLISNKLLTRESNSGCGRCGSYSLGVRDIFYQRRHDMCFRCYIKYKADR